MGLRRNTEDRFEGLSELFLGDPDSRAPVKMKVFPWRSLLSTDMLSWQCQAHQLYSHLCALRFHQLQVTVLAEGLDSERQSVGSGPGRAGDGDNLRHRVSSVCLADSALPQFLSLHPPCLPRSSCQDLYWPYPQFDRLSYPTGLKCNF